MEVKLAQYTNKGMNKDLSISKSSEEFAYNNENIRITTTGKESLLSITNERSSIEIPITEIKKTIPVNWFRYTNMTRDSKGDYYLNFESDYPIKKDIEFNVTLQYYNQEGIQRIFRHHEAGRDWYESNIYIISKRYTHQNLEENKTYYIWELYWEYDNTEKIYFINENKDYLSLTDTAYVKCESDDPDKSIQIGQSWYKDFEAQPYQSYFVVKCFRMHGRDEDIDRFTYNETHREHTFTLTANVGASKFSYKIKDLPNLTTLLPHNSQQPKAEDFWGWGTGINSKYNFNLSSDILVKNVLMNDSDDSFYYTTDENFKPTPIVEDKIYGDYIGHCIANNYLVLFTRNNNKDYIYRISADNNTYTAKLLYKGDLGFSTEKSIETLYYYESEDIQKVYWVDGVHQTRVINIMKEDYINGESNQFDFVPNIRKSPMVSITKRYDAIGNFHSGVIQYFITYYNKFGAETKIVYGSPLNYITFDDRAGAADEFCSCSFNIKVSNIDTKFDYLRIYSVKRQSIDGPVEVNIVSDIKISGRDIISITDIGANQVALDSNIIYFLGGSNFIAETLAQKDDTLFLANIRLSENEIPDGLKPYIKDNWINDSAIKESKRISFIDKCFTDASPSGLYPFKSQLNNSSITFKGFKFGEIYRFGIQYQEQNGSWTQPIWIGDKKCTIHPKRLNRLQQTAVPTAVFKLSSDELNPNSTYAQYVKNYIGYRLVMAKTDINSRSVLAQGIVCPTIFNYKQRIDDKPYSFASYIMRPRNSNVESRHLYPVDEIFGTKRTLLPIREEQSDNLPITDVNKVYAKFYVGVIKTFVFPVLVYGISSFCYIYIEDSHGGRSNGVLLWDYAPHISVYTNSVCYDDMMNSLRGIIGDSYTSGNSAFLSKTDCDDMHNDIPPSGWTRRANLDKESVWGTTRFYQKTFEIQNYNDDALYRKYLKEIGEQHEGTIPEEIPGSFDKEFYVDESIVTLNSPDLMNNFNQINQSGLNFRIVGIAPITGNSAAFKLDVDENTKYTHPGNPLSEVSNKYISENIYYNPRSMTSDYLYHGAYFNGNTFANYDNYKIYMWHHIGSIIGYQDADGYKDVLESKTFSNKRFSIATEYFNENVNIPISKPEVFNEDYIALKKIKLQSKNGNYYGNYNTSMIMNESGSDIERENPENSGDIKKTQDPVDIRFNSTPHAVFSLCGDVKIGDKIKSTMYLLPMLKSDYKYKDYTNYIFGEESIDSINLDNVVNVVGIVHRTSKTLLEDFKDFVENYPEAVAGVGSIIMTSSSGSDVALPTISGIYKVTGSSSDVYSFISCYDEYSTYIFTIQNQCFYKNLENANNDKTIYYKFCVNSYNGELVLVDNLLKPYIRCSTINYTCKYPYLLIGELYKEIPYDTLYGGYYDNALENITWLPISGVYSVLSLVDKTEGDTYYQRWDCVKTIPFSTPGVNNVIDITSVMLESHICLDGRWDKNRVDTDLININTNNYNLFNDVYSQSNNLFTYNILDDKYDLDIFKNQVIWSKQKTPTEDVDTWTNISQLNSLYLDGELGGVNKLVNFNDSIIAFQDKGISVINFNNQTQISTEQGLPIEVVNSGKVTGYNYLTKVNGCINKWSIAEGVSGLFFIDSLNKSIFRFNKEGLTNLSASLGFADWSKENISLNKWTIDTDAFRTSSDKITHDVYFTNNEKCLCYNEDTQTFTSFYTEYVNNVSMFNLDGKSYYLGKDLKIHKMFSGDYIRNFSIEFNVNPEPLDDKIFTNIEYISDTVNNKELQRVNPFSTLIVSTEYQDGETNLLGNKYPNAATKFRIWRADVPRDRTHKLDRIRNPWARFKLIGNDNISGMTTLHSLTVKYFK